MFRWNDEDCYFEKTVSPEEAIARWTELFQEQYDNGDDCYYEEDMTGGTGLYVEDYDSPEEEAEIKRKRKEARERNKINKEAKKNMQLLF